MFLIQKGVGFPTPFLKPKKMKVKFLQPMAGPNKIYNVGEVYTVSEFKGANLIKAKIAELVSEPIKKEVTKKVKKQNKKK